MRRRFFLLAALAIAPSLARASGGGGEKKTTGGTNYLPMRALTGTINKPGGRRGVMSVECGLEVNDTGLREKAEKSLPRLRAAYLQTVLTYAGGLPYGAPPNTDFLARTMQRQTDEMLGRKGAQILLGSVLIN